MTNEISQMRSEVIEKAINIEWMINSIICQKYFGYQRIDFISELLYDEYCQFALKRRVLLKICSELTKEFENNLNRLNTIRNYFAHVGPEVIDGPILQGPTRVPDPRDFSKSVDFANLHKEFLELERAISTTLFETFKAKGGQFVK
jgi:hypothetical protein